MEKKFHIMKMEMFMINFFLLMENWKENKFHIIGMEIFFYKNGFYIKKVHIK